MKIKHLVPVAIAATAIALSQVATSAQAAMLIGGNGTPTCNKVDNNFFIECAGWFDGNDKGAQGTGLANLNSIFGGDWSLQGDSDSSNPLVKFVTGGDGTRAGTATTNLSGKGAIAVKAGNSYSLYTVADLANFSWSTAGVKPVGKGNIPGLSHISVYKSAIDNPPEEPQKVPEPGILLGLVGIASIGTRLKKRS